MDWSASIFSYCERAADPSFWAEPFNAVSNLSFIIAAYLAAEGFRRRSHRPDPAVWLLIALTAIIGVGSFLFHTLATRWSALADVVPIGLFMLSYLVFAVRRFAQAPWWATIALLAFYLACVWTAVNLPCPAGLLPVTEAMDRPCLNGSMLYIPSWIALTGMAIYLAHHRLPAAGYLSKASVILAVALFLRTIDFEVCGSTTYFGSPRGTHAFWHLLNGLMLYALLRAAIENSVARSFTGEFDSRAAARPWS